MSTHFLRIKCRKYTWLSTLMIFFCWAGFFIAKPTEWYFTITHSKQRKCGIVWAHAQCVYNVAASPTHSTPSSFLFIFMILSLSASLTFSGPPADCYPRWCPFYCHHLTSLRTTINFDGDLAVPLRNNNFRLSLNGVYAILRYHYGLWVDFIWVCA